MCTHAAHFAWFASMRHTLHDLHTCGTLCWNNWTKVHKMCPVDNFECACGMCKYFLWYNHLAVSPKYPLKSFKKTAKLKWTSMRCRNKQKPIYFKEFLIFFLHSKCDMKLRLYILRSDIFIFCKNSSRRTHCVQMRMSPNNFDIFEVNKLRFQDEKCDFLKKSETLVKR